MCSWRIARRIASASARPNATQELSDERARLGQWQAGLAGGGAAQRQPGAAGPPGAQQQGDESDYEDDCEEPQQEEGAEGGGAQPQAQQEPASGEGASGAGGASDHPHYHGRGWWPGRGEPGERSDSDSSESAVQEDGSDKAAADGVRETCSSDKAQEEEHPVAPAAGSPPPSPPLAAPRAVVAAAPVKVTFTALESPHLPAREQREEELRLRKKRGGALVRRALPPLAARPA